VSCVWACMCVACWGPLHTLPHLSVCVHVCTCMSCACRSLLCLHVLVQALWGSGPEPDAVPLGSWGSDSAGLDAVWHLCAYTIVATTLDVNVDSQTRQRDICVVDALNTALGQFHVLPPGETSVPDRTLLEIFTNDSGEVWPWLWLWVLDGFGMVLACGDW
jgi:hypothetical protein